MRCGRYKNKKLFLHFHNFYSKTARIVICEQFFSQGLSGAYPDFCVVSGCNYSGTGTGGCRPNPTAVLDSIATACPRCALPLGFKFSVVPVSIPMIQTHCRGRLQEHPRPPPLCKSHLPSWRTTPCYHICQRQLQL